MPKVFTKSNALYERALQTIPLASQTFSKSASQYVRGVSPLFLEKGKGCYVWDIDGNKYIDYVSGLMPVILGYCDADVDNAIKKQLKKGISFSLSTALEVTLAEILVDIIPCAEMVRFGKNGSDVTSAAIRLARAYTKRDRVAVCGYHGWHDWYIGTTTRDLGVPEAVKALSLTFQYNHIESLEKILKQYPTDIAAIIMEPVAGEEPKEGYLQEVRRLATRYGCVLIFDEIVTGFRVSLGGAQAHYNVTPDLACFGKAMANGMPISAIVGRKVIMKEMENIFFSGTFGGETLSIAAAIATISKLQELDVPEKLKVFSGKLRHNIEKKIHYYQVSEAISIKGCNWRPYVSLKDNNITWISYIRQKMVEAGILMGNGFNLSLAHCEAPIYRETIDAWEYIVSAFAKDYKAGTLRESIQGELVQPVFQVRAHG